MLNQSIACYPKEPDFLRSQSINIVGRKWAHKRTKRSLGTIFTSLAEFPFKHGATVVKGLEKLLDIQFENIRLKLLFISNWKSSIRTWLAFAITGQINHAQWTHCDPALLSACDCFIPGESRCPKTTTPWQCTFAAAGLTPSRLNAALAAVGLDAKRSIEGKRNLSRSFAKPKRASDARLKAKECRVNQLDNRKEKKKALGLRQTKHKRICNNLCQQ